MIVAGIDPSLTSTGIALINTDTGSVELHTVKSKGLATDPVMTRWERLKKISIEVRRIIYGSALVVIEGPSMASRHGSKHDRSGLWWMIVAHARAIDAAVTEVPPTVRAKYATGKGNANKDDVLLAVDRRYGSLVRIGGNDQADALVFAAMGARSLGYGIEDSLPKVNIAAMQTVVWPWVYEVEL
ncbi:MAG TPA: crossover junction endodeoxyribonuclease RuvC [Pseudonocardia sp.]|uniref:crossover junction endodeoxyribonuclease RuvC n=1 Tax=Pseudonocardia sp. TaxID=60912 RepID=UPI002C494F2A|nr:crossover junction endodeoxyribonuclease RuvC [Pseudonocardia sp.]HTF53655.1 crossover junction endodeoxyribonuclease RuvC [Pseudonocardia sp.]